MTRRVVLLNHGKAHFLLSDVEPETGVPKFGYVVNGNWYWQRVNGEERALDEFDNIVNRWPANDYGVVEVPEDKSAGYNSIMTWAESETPSSAIRNHVFYECKNHGGCKKPGRCPYCDGGLAYCIVCNQAECELEDSCPGKPTNKERANRVYGKLVR